MFVVLAGDFWLPELLRDNYFATGFLQQVCRAHLLWLPKMLSPPPIELLRYSVPILRARKPFHRCELLLLWPGSLS